MWGDKWGEGQRVYDRFMNSMKGQVKPSLKLVFIGGGRGGQEDVMPLHYQPITYYRVTMLGEGDLRYKFAGKEHNRRTKETKYFYFFEEQEEYVGRIFGWEVNRLGLEIQIAGQGEGVGRFE